MFSVCRWPSTRGYSDISVSVGSSVGGAGAASGLLVGEPVDGPVEVAVDMGLSRHEAAEEVARDRLLGSVGGVGLVDVGGLGFEGFASVAQPGERCWNVVVEGLRHEAVDTGV